MQRVGTLKVLTKIEVKVCVSVCVCQDKKGHIIKGEKNKRNVVITGGES